MDQTTARSRGAFVICPISVPSIAVAGPCGCEANKRSLGYWSPPKLGTGFGRGRQLALLQRVRER